MTGWMNEVVHGFLGVSRDGGREGGVGAGVCGVLFVIGLPICSLVHSHSECFSTHSWLTCMYENERRVHSVFQVSQVREAALLQSGEGRWGRENRPMDKWMDGWMDGGSTCVGGGGWVNNSNHVFPKLQCGRVAHTTLTSSALIHHSIASQTSAPLSIKHRERPRTQNQPITSRRNLHTRHHKAKLHLIYQCTCMCCCPSYPYHRRSPSPSYGSSTCPSNTNGATRPSATRAS